jgi:hypothetical protein
MKRVCQYHKLLIVQRIQVSTLRPSIDIEDGRVWSRFRRWMVLYSSMAGTYILDSINTTLIGEGMDFGQQESKHSSWQ